MSRRPVPLMFIQSPSVISTDPIDYEESTSIFEKEVFTPIGEEDDEFEKERSTVIDKQLKKIQSPFGKHLYKPLQIKLVNDQVVSGTILEVKGNEIYVMGDDKEQNVFTIRDYDVIDILWQGKSLSEK